MTIEQIKNIKTISKGKGEDADFPEFAPQKAVTGGLL
jgi:hypothetical protein